MQIDSEKFASRYAAVWNEPDPQARRDTIAELWAPDGVQFLEPTEYRGHRDLETRVTEAYEQFVEAAGFVFVPAGDAVAHHDTIIFRVQMVPAGGGEVAWTGTIVLELDADGRISRDHQYAVPAGPTRTVVLEFLARLGDGDPERVAELFAERVDWQLDWPEEGHPAVPWIRPRSTRADVAEHFRALAEHHGGPETARETAQETAQPPTILVDGPDAVLLTEIRQTARATGRRYAARCALRLTVVDGLITRYHVYEDSLTVARAFAANGAAPS